MNLQEVVAMVDFESRARLRALLEQFFDGAITMDDYMDISEKLVDSSDVGVAEIARFGQGFWDDLSFRRKLRGVDPATRVIVGRCLKFLATDRDFRWPPWNSHPHPRSCLVLLLAILLATPGLILGAGAFILAIVTAFNDLWIGSKVAFVGTLLFLPSVGIVWWAYCRDLRREQRVFDAYYSHGDRNAWPFLTLEELMSLGFKPDDPAIQP